MSPGGRQSWQFYFDFIRKTFSRKILAITHQLKKIHCFKFQKRSPLNQMSTFCVTNFLSTFVFNVPSIFVFNVLSIFVFNVLSIFVFDVLSIFVFDVLPIFVAPPKYWQCPSFYWVTPILQQWKVGKHGHVGTWTFQQVTNFAE